MLRARSPLHRAQRLDEILAAVANLFDAVGPGLTLDRVADEVGLTRSTLYGYASTREELLLLLVDAELFAWFKEIDTPLRRCRTHTGVARVLTEHIIARPRLPPLLAQCGIVLEHNVSLEAAKRWKLRVHDGLLEAGLAIDAGLRLRSGTGSRFLLHVYACVVGLHSLSAPPPIAEKAIAESGLDALLIDFDTELRLAVRSLANAILTIPSTKEHP